MEEVIKVSSILIIGGSDAGISAALRIKELQPRASVTMLVADAYPNYSICGLPFYLSGEVPDWHQLAHRTLEEIQSAGVTVQLNTRAVEIHPKAHTVVTLSDDWGKGTLDYDRLVIATGSEPVCPPIRGIDERGVFLLHSMGDSFAVAEFLRRHQPRRALIIGAGYIGLEMADALTHRGLAVTLVEQQNTVLPTVDAPMGTVLGHTLATQGIDVRTGVKIDQIEQTGHSLRVLGTLTFDQEVDMVLVVVGVQPVTSLFKQTGLRLGVRGAIPVNRAMATELPDVYAAGDCVETYHRILGTDTYLPLGTTAHKQGRTAGENVVGGTAQFAGTLGTQVVKLFELAVARTGLRDHEAKAAGYAPKTVQCETWDHKAYYPGAQSLTFRITGDTRTGQLLGAQILGHWQASVAKRADLFAMALYHSMTISELMAVDLSYTPPLGSPWDAVQMAAHQWLSEAGKPTD